MSPATPSPAANKETRNLDRKVAAGVAWTAGAKWASQVFSWASLLIVARLLSPADYGTAEMAGVVFALTNTLAEFGVGTAVLHMPELEERALHQLHTFSLMLCSGMYLVLLLLSPLVALFFKTPNLIALLAVNNLTFFVTGFQAVPLGLLQRDMNYRRLSVSEGMMYLVQAFVTVIAAWRGLGYWSLVLGVVLGKTTNAIMVSFWKPLGFQFPRWRDIGPPLQMGRQAAIGGMAWTAYLHCDGVVVGRLLGQAPLGIYRMAMNLANAPAEKVSMLIMRTAGPLFANIQTDLDLVRRYFLILSDTLALAIAPAMVGLIMVAPDAVPLLLGPQWSKSVPPLIWLAFYMILSTMNTLIGQVLVSQRRTRLTMATSILNLCILPPALAIGAWLGGVPGVAAAWVVTAPITLVILAITLFRRIELRVRDFVRSLWPVFAGTVTMALFLLAVHVWLTGITMPLGARVGIQVVSGALVYLAVLLLFFREKLWRYVRFLQGLRSGAAV